MEAVRAYLVAWGLDLEKAQPLDLQSHYLALERTLTDMKQALAELEEKP